MGSLTNSNLEYARNKWYQLYNHVGGVLSSLNEVEYRYDPRDLSHTLSISMELMIGKRYDFLSRFTELQWTSNEFFQAIDRWFKEIEDEVFGV